MTIDTAITRIIDGWDGWTGEAMHDAQVEQDPRAGEAVMRDRLRSVLEKIDAEFWERGVPDYDTCVHIVNNLPKTWYPALLGLMVTAAYRSEVFVPGGASSFVEKTEQAMGRAATSRSKP